MIRVRFAPSPTGSLHLGSLRTAIINYLFAKKTGASLVLRIEDTDKERSSESSTATIVENLEWMGISFDEGPFFQSKRVSIYDQYVQMLLDNDKAYYCFCPDKESESEFPVKDPCRHLSKQEAETNLKQSKPYTIRLRIPDETIRFKDLVKGNISFEGHLLEDFVIARTDGSVTYNFAVVVDDYEMAISHIIRGEDHLSNTPKQIALYHAFGWVVPQFAHIPLILGPDKTKLSKRHCDTAIEDYKRNGFLPEAIFNYLALLGYSHDPAAPVMTKHELIQHFNWVKVSRSPSQFDIQRLLWMNKQYLGNMDNQQFLELAKSWVSDITMDEQKKGRILLLSRNQIRLWSDLPSVFKPFLEYKIPDDTLSALVTQQNSGLPFIVKVKENLLECDFSLQALQDIIEGVIEQMQLKKRDAIQWLRVVLTGSVVSPSLYDTLQILGKKESLARLGVFLEKQA